VERTAATCAAYVIRRMGCASVERVF